MRIEAIHRGLAARLRTRRSDIVQAVLDRVYGLADPAEATDPTYLAGLKTAVTVAIDHGIDSLERTESSREPVPIALLSQAALAARSGVPLETVLRRYFAGYSLFGDFLLEEAERLDVLRRGSLQRLLRGQAALLDRLLVAVSDEYGREQALHRHSTEERRVRQVERLLAGNLPDAIDLGYEFDCWHLGILAVGSDSGPAIRELAPALDCRLMLVCRDDATIWAWLGSRRAPDVKRLLQLASSLSAPKLKLALGEPAPSLTGWRLSHRQAAAALPVVLRAPQQVVRYRDVALLAAILGNDLLATSLRQLYLEPLEVGPDGGEPLKETLRAYLLAERNVSSAAAALGVSRRTVSNRLRVAESKLDLSLASNAPEIEAAVRLLDLGD